MDILIVTALALLSLAATDSYDCSLGKFPNNCKCFNLGNKSDTISLSCNVTNKIQLHNMRNSEYAPHVSYLVLNLQRLQKLPSKAFKYRNLNMLFISSDGYLNRVSDGAFRGLRGRLTTLWLTDTNLSAVPMEALNRLKSLRTLHLGRNLITSLDYSLRDWMLTKLYLKQNRISEIGSGILPTTLKHLDLSRNRIHSLTDTLQGNYSQLDTLIITLNRIEHIGYEFENTPNLEYLYADGNLIRNIMDGAFAKATNLLEIYLRDNRIQSIQRGLKGLRNLEMLFLEDNDIEYVTSLDFADLRALRQLGLSRNNIDEIDEDSFDCLNSLITLFVDSNRFTKLNFLRKPCASTYSVEQKVFCNFRYFIRLDWVDIRDNNMTCDKNTEEILQYASLNNVSVVGSPCQI